MTLPFLAGVDANALLSPCGTYRYALTRDWYPKGGLGHVLWIMLNPSTADAETDDRTIRRCQDYARTWGYDGITVANLFALRATKPAALFSHPDPVGPANDDVLAALLAARGVGMVVAGWGVLGRHLLRYADIVRLAGKADRDLYALALTKDGQPRHPLYLAGELTPFVWRSAE